MKTCYKCKRDLSIISFSKDRSKKDGLNSECRDCSSKRNKKYRENNKERIKEKYLKYYEKNREKVLTRNRAWREKNLEKAKEYRKRHYRENRERTLEQTRKYQREHREYYRSRSRLIFHDTRVKAMKFLNPDLDCEKCGIKDLRLLTVDHKNNDGYQERKKRTSHQIFKAFMKLPPSEARKRYQVLCHNCNWLRRYEGDEVL